MVSNKTARGIAAEPYSGNGGEGVGVVAVGLLVVWVGEEDGDGEVAELAADMLT